MSDEKKENEKQLEIKKPGAPLKYNENKPKELIALMKKGYKDCQIWAEWKISKATYWRWMEEYPEFKEAHEVGLGLCETAWESKGLELMAAGDNKAFNYWIAFMNRKFGWHKKDGEQNNSATTNINIQQMNVLQGQTKEQLVEYIKSKVSELEILDSPTIIEAQPLKELTKPSEDN